MTLKAKDDDALAPGSGGSALARVDKEQDVYAFVWTELPLAELAEQVQSLEAALDDVEQVLRAREAIRGRLRDELHIARRLFDAKRSVEAASRQRHDSAPAGRSVIEMPASPRVSAVDAVRSLFRAEPEREWRAAEIVQAVEELGWAPPTIQAVRVALARLTAAGELERIRHGGYRLSRRPGDRHDSGRSGGALSHWP